MRISKLSSHAEPKIDMTPMIDCVFLLLIFFMCAATMAKVDKSAEVNLPVASNAAEQKDPKNRGTVNVLRPGMRAKDGQEASDSKPFVIYGQLQSDEELQRVIEKELKTKPDLRLYVRADRQVKFALIRRAMAACANAGVSDVIFGAYAQDME
jgi:biopolymer transport protein ExbD